LDARAVIQALELSPHPEGGHFRETYRGSPCPFPWPERGQRATSTAIYFLLAPGEFSALHQVSSDEGWHHYLGGALELVSIDPDGALSIVRMGKDIVSGERPQHVVPAGFWQAARVVGDEAVLCGCTVAPGFDFADFAIPPRADLLARFPQHAALVTALSR
jgi:hypothetical protein